MNIKKYKDDDPLDFWIEVLNFIRGCIDLGLSFLETIRSFQKLFFSERDNYF